MSGFIKEFYNYSGNGEDFVETFDCFRQNNFRWPKLLEIVWRSP